MIGLDVTAWQIHVQYLLKIRTFACKHFTKMKLSFCVNKTEADISTSCTHLARISLPCIPFVVTLRHLQIVLNSNLLTQNASIFELFSFSSNFKHSTSTGIRHYRFSSFYWVPLGHVQIKERIPVFHCSCKPRRHLLKMVTQISSDNLIFIHVLHRKMTTLNDVFLWCCLTNEKVFRRLGKGVIPTWLRIHRLPSSSFRLISSKLFYLKLEALLAISA